MFSLMTPTLARRSTTRKTYARSKKPTFAEQLENYSMANLELQLNIFTNDLAGTRKSANRANLIRAEIARRTKV